MCLTYDQATADYSQNNWCVAEVLCTAEKYSNRLTFSEISEHMYMYTRIQKLKIRHMQQNKWKFICGPANWCMPLEVSWRKHVSLVSSCILDILYAMWCWVATNYVERKLHTYEHHFWSCKHIRDCCAMKALSFC